MVTPANAGVTIGMHFQPVSDRDVTATNTETKEESMARFSGKTVVVTGASRGIGEAIARRFAEEGATVVAVGRTARDLEALCQKIATAGGHAVPCVLDISEPGAAQQIVQMAVDQHGSIDVLINNAGIIEPFGPFIDITEEAWRRTLEVNVTSAFLLSQAAAKVMMTRRQGAIVLIASIDGSCGDGPYAAYNTSKAGMLGLMRTMALELGPSNIRVVAVSPGFTDTAMLEDDLGPEIMAALRADFVRAPLRRMVKPEEIASVCAFVASDDASSITGANVVVDGGVSADLFVLPTIPERADVVTT